MFIIKLAKLDFDGTATIDIIFSLGVRQATHGAHAIMKFLPRYSQVHSAALLHSCIFIEFGSQH